MATSSTTVQQSRRRMPGAAAFRRAGDHATVLLIVVCFCFASMAVAGTGRGLRQSALAGGNGRGLLQSCANECACKTESSCTNGLPKSACCWSASERKCYLGSASGLVVDQSNGACAITCSGTSLNCDNAFANGCETDGTSLENCGSCANVCPTRVNAVRTCSGTPPACGFTCDTGFYDVNGVASDGCEAKKCPAGTYSDSGYYPASSTAEASCTRCPAGTYSSAVGADSIETCTRCAAGTYSSALGATSVATCTACAAGTYSSAVGAINVEACTACAAGTYSSAVGANSADTCTRCAAGTYSSAMGATSDATCTACAAGTASSASGAGSAATCVTCPIKFWSAAGAPSCTSCGAGKTTAWKGSDDAGDCVDAASDVGAWDIDLWRLNSTWYTDRQFDTAARWIWSSLPDYSTSNKVTKEDEIAVLTRQFEAQSGVPLEIYIAADNGAQVFIDGVFLVASSGGWPGTNRPLVLLPLPALTGVHTITLRGQQAKNGAYNPAGVIAGIRNIATKATVLVTDDTWTRTTTTAPDTADLVPSTTPLKAFSNGIFGVGYGWWVWSNSYDQGVAPGAPADVINVFKATYTATETVGDVEFNANDAVCELFVNGLYIGSQAYTQFRFNGIALNGGVNTFVFRCTNPIYCGSGATGACAFVPTQPNNAWLAFRLVIGGVAKFFTSDWVTGSAATSPCNNNGQCSGWNALTHN